MKSNIIESKVYVNTYIYIKNKAYSTIAPINYKSSHIMCLAKQMWLSELSNIRII